MAKFHWPAGAAILGCTGSCCTSWWCNHANSILLSSSSIHKILWTLEHGETMVPVALLFLGERATGSCTIFYCCLPCKSFNVFATSTGHSIIHIIFLQLIFIIPSISTASLCFSLDFNHPLVLFHGVASFCSSRPCRRLPLEPALVGLVRNTPLPFHHLTLQSFTSLSLISSHAVPPLLPSYPMDLINSCAFMGHEQVISRFLCSLDRIPLGFWISEWVTFDSCFRHVPVLSQTGFRQVSFMTVRHDEVFYPSWVFLQGKDGF